ncbi:MAG TPA: folate-binding protein [Gammaproteobacteria bacterium]
MLPDKPILVDLSYKGLLCASGPDAVAFLQGQFSTDLERLTPDISQLSCWSNAKGRVVAVLRLFRRGEHIHIALAASLKSAVLKRLSMYVLRSKVQLEDAGDSISTLGLIGEGAPALLAQAGIPVPSRVNDLTRMDGIQAIRLHGDSRYAIYGGAEAMAVLKRRWEPVTTSGTEDIWALHKILAGEPTVFAETSEHFVAQMLGLAELGAIDFKKGCYIGQEVIARAHYRGGVKRHMVRAESRTSVQLRPGAQIHAQGHDAPVAEVVDARQDAQDIWQILMVLQDDFKDAALLHAASGAPMKLVSW